MKDSQLVPSHDDVESSPQVFVEGTPLKHSNGGVPQPLTSYVSPIGGSFEAIQVMTMHWDFTNSVPSYFWMMEIHVTRADAGKHGETNSEDPPNL